MSLSVVSSMLCVFARETLCTADFVLRQHDHRSMETSKPCMLSFPHSKFSARTPVSFPTFTLHNRCCSCLCSD